MLLQTLIAHLAHLTGEYLSSINHKSERDLIVDLHSGISDEQLLLLHIQKVAYSTPILLHLNIENIVLLLQLNIIEKQPLCGIESRL